MTQQAIEPATFRLVAQCLIQLPYLLPPPVCTILYFTTHNIFVGCLWFSERREFHCLYSNKCWNIQRRQPVLCEVDEFTLHRFKWQYIYVSGFL